MFSNCVDSGEYCCDLGKVFMTSWAISAIASSIFTRSDSSRWRLSRRLDVVFIFISRVGGATSCMTLLGVVERAGGRKSFIAASSTW